MPNYVSSGYTPASQSYKPVNPFREVPRTVVPSDIPGETQAYRDQLKKKGSQQQDTSGGTRAQFAITSPFRNRYEAQQASGGGYQRPLIINYGEQQKLSTVPGYNKGPGSVVYGQRVQTMDLPHGKTQSSWTTRPTKDIPPAPAPSPGIDLSAELDLLKKQQDEYNELLNRLKKEPEVSQDVKIEEGVTQERPQVLPLAPEVPQSMPTLTTPTSQAEESVATSEPVYSSVTSSQKDYTPWIIGAAAVVALLAMGRRK